MNCCARIPEAACRIISRVRLSSASVLRARPTTTWVPRKCSSTRSGSEPLILVLAAEEAFVDPDTLEVPDQIVRGDRLMARLPAVVFLHRFVQRRAVDDPVIPEHRDAQDVDELVLERTRRVVVDL